MHGLRQNDPSIMYDSPLEYLRKCNLALDTILLVFHMHTPGSTLVHVRLSAIRGVETISLYPMGYSCTAHILRLCVVCMYVECLFKFCECTNSNTPDQSLHTRRLDPIEQKVRSHGHVSVLQ